jgi:hypothetical protein
MALSTKVLVQRLLAKVISKPGVDIFMRKDIKNFLYNYGKELNSNTTPIMVTSINVGGAALSVDSSSGFIIEPNPGLRLYGVKITIEGNTAYTFSYNYDGVDVSIEEPGGETLIGEDLSEGSIPTTSGLTEGNITIFCDDSSIPDPNSLTGLTLIVRLYTA